MDGDIKFLEDYGNDIRNEIIDILDELKKIIIFLNI